MSHDPMDPFGAGPPSGDGAAPSGREATPSSLRATEPREYGQAPERREDGAQRGGERRRRRGEDSMVPRAEFRDYYGNPVIKAPSWEPRDIAGYFFLGGLAGAGSVLAAGAHATDRPTTASRMKVSSLGAVSLATAALIHDLGRPARFTNMLRVFRVTSPMNMGSWLLMGYGPAAGAAATAAVGRRLPRTGAAATAAASLLGPVVATYTAVLAADTAVPAWHGAHRELPYLFAASATAAASGMALVVGPTHESRPARTAAALAAVAEGVAEKAVERRLGDVAETMRYGRAGKLMRAARTLTAAGAAAAALGGRSRHGAALLAGSACTRFGVFHAGIASADDPVYTVGPQRTRKDGQRRERHGEQREQSDREPERAPGAGRSG